MPFELGTSKRPGSMTAAGREDKALCFQATKYFGTWLKALRAAGFEPTTPQWTKQTIIDGDPCLVSATIAVS